MNRYMTVEASFKIGDGEWDWYEEKTLSNLGSLGAFNIEIIEYWEQS